MMTAKKAAESPTVAQQNARFTKKRHLLMWIVLLLACLEAIWFSSQYFLISQPEDYAPDWHGAQWVQAADSRTPVTYFRYVFHLDSLPDAAFVTIAANQTFLLYVNGNYISASNADFAQGETARAYLYDVDSFLKPGPNSIAARVMNLDMQTPALRASLGILWGKTFTYHGTGNSGWQATGQSALARPRYTPKKQNWTMPLFDASTWEPAVKATNVPGSPMLSVDPLLHEQPLPTSWINAGPGHESYFTRQFSLSDGFTDVLLRLTATNTAYIFINGQPFAVWKSQAITPKENVVSYMSDGVPVAMYRSGLAMGVYEISPYLHAGTNTIAVHVISPGLSVAKVGLATSGSAMSLDILARRDNRPDTVVTSDSSWHASSQPVAGWEQASAASLAWPPAILIGRPGNSREFYLPENNTPRNIEVLSPVLVIEVIFLTVLAVAGLWLLMSLVVVRRYYPSRVKACEAMSLAFLPSLALGAVLITLSREPLMPQPFPYTRQWGLTLIGLVVASFLLLWLHARNAFLLQPKPVRAPLTAPDNTHEQINLVKNRRFFTRLICSCVLSQPKPVGGGRLMEYMRPWLAKHWLLIPLMLVAIPLISYHVGYEPYWQDELSSYNAARGILAHGIPVYLSGFLYAKGEAYSYLLALSTILFGDQNGMPRLISMLEYLVSLPLFYGIGCYFFDRRVAFLATAMLTFSPYALLWGRQVRMYEQAFFMALIFIYALYYALQHYQRARPVYLAVACIVLAYFSHEEIFIFLPAIIICVLLFSPRGTYGNPLVLRQKHWWYALLIGVALIGLQLLIVFVTHPAFLGTDQSRRPQVQLTFDNIPFYLGLFFNSRVLREGIAPWIIIRPLLTISSILAIVGCVQAFYRGDSRARYCAAMLIIPVLTLAFVFTMQADRYIYPLLSVYYFMSSYATLRILRALWVFSRPYLKAHRFSGASASDSIYALPRLGRVIVLGTVSLFCTSVLILPMLPLSNYNLFFSRATGISYHRHFPDYDGAGQYVQDHWKEGDIIATIAPDLTTYYYFHGHAEYFFSIDRSLYLFEQNGQIVDLPLGKKALLNQADLQTLLATHARIWLVSDNGSYQAGASKEGRFIFPPPDFQLVYEGYGSAVYFRGKVE